MSIADVDHMKMRGSIEKSVSCWMDDSFMKKLWPIESLIALPTDLSVGRSIEQTMDTPRIILHAWMFGQSNEYKQKAIYKAFLLFMHLAAAIHAIVMLAFLSIYVFSPLRSGLKSSSL